MTRRRYVCSSPTCQPCMRSIRENVFIASGPLPPVDPSHSEPPSHGATSALTPLHTDTLGWTDRWDEQTWCLWEKTKVLLIELLRARMCPARPQPEVEQEREKGRVDRQLWEMTEMGRESTSAERKVTVLRRSPAQVWVARWWAEKLNLGEKEGRKTQGGFGEFFEPLTRID